MKVAIIGAGFGGLATAYYLSKVGVDLTVFESNDRPGGLAVGFKEDKWKWPLEKYYHHWFTSDLAVMKLAEEIGQEFIFTRPKTSTFIDGKIFQLDTPLSLMLFNKLSVLDRLRTGAILAYLKITPYFSSLEKITARDFIIEFMGSKSWEVIWEPLFEKKFSRFADKIPASWFWARIKKRSAALGYPKGGFLMFAQRIIGMIQKNKGKVLYKTKVTSLSSNNNSKKLLLTTDREKFEFDKVVCTLPFSTFVKITKGLSKEYIDELLDLKSIGAINLVLSLNRRFLEDGTYWLNINAKHFPFLAVVEHTNFIDKKNYNNEYLVYVANYLPHNHDYYQKDAISLLKEFYPFLKMVNTNFDKSWINSIFLFKAPSAQPIIPLNYSRRLPTFETPIKGLYLCNMQQVYPWDRGTNYAVENAEKVVKLIINEK